VELVGRLSIVSHFFHTPRTVKGLGSRVKETIPKNKVEQGLALCFQASYDRKMHRKKGLSKPVNVGYEHFYPQAIFKPCGPESLRLEPINRGRLREKK
jgi:hypothetical protein